MLRVLHVLCDLSGGGAERLVLELCRAGRVHQEVTAVHAQPATLAEPFRLARVRVHPGTRERHTAGALTIGRIAHLAQGFDLVHTHLWAGDMWGVPAARLARKPVVSTEHNVNLDEGRARRLAKRALSPWVHRRVYVSEAAREFARTQERIRHGRTCVIPNGVDLARFGPPAPGRAAGERPPDLPGAQETPRVAKAPGRTDLRGGPDVPGLRILAVGRDVPQKGFDLLVQALPAGSRLTVAGASAHRGTHTVPAAPDPQGGTAEGRGLATVIWLGERDDVPALLASADVLAVPSRWEGFGLAAVEGLAAGVAVVATRTGGLPEVLGDAALFVPPGDVAALAGALRHLAVDAPARALLAERGPARASLFSIARCADQYAALYAAVVEEAKGVAR